MEDAILATKPDWMSLVQRLNEAEGEDHVASILFTTGTRVRQMYHLATYGLGAKFRMHCNDVQTALRGVLERVFFHWETRGGVRVMARPLKPTYAVVCALLGKARRKLLSLAPLVSPMTRAEFLSRLSGRKLTRYEGAADSVEAKPIEPKDAFMSPFVKAEKLNVTVEPGFPAPGKPDPDPRMIQCRNVRYLYASGLHIKALEKEIYRMIDRLFGYRVVMKGKNADQRGRYIHTTWSKHTNPRGVGADASRWDQHVSLAMLLFEHSVYKSMARDKFFSSLLKMQEVNEGFVVCPDGSFNYVVEGSRMSGDMNTALGNVLLMCLIMYSYFQTKDFPISLINDGDDCVLVVDKEHVHKLADMPEFFESLGFVMKVEEPVAQLELVEFCQSNPIEVNPGCWRMVRNPWLTISKDLAVPRPLESEVDFQYHRRNVGECGLALAGDIPVYWEFYTSLCAGTASRRLDKRKAREGLVTGAEYLSLGMQRKRICPSDTARVSFFKAFGITPDEQLALESTYRSWRPVWRKPISTQNVLDVFQTST